jgi:iron complex transport system permease protein
MNATLPPGANTPKRVGAGRLALVLSLVLLALTSLGAAVGSTGLSSLAELLTSQADPLAMQLVMDIRLPRTLGALAAGALLGLAGAIAQGLFRNPLTDPFLLGSASGAALGVALALALFGGSAGAGGLISGQWLVRLGLTGAAFCGAVAGVALTLVLARGVHNTLRLLLGGVIVGVVLGAAKDLVVQGAPEIVQAMQGFNLGSTAFVGWAACALMLLAWLVCALVATALGHVMDGLALGESTARSLGLPLGVARVALICALALATGTAVAQTGLIAFIGLAAPHMVRAIAPCTHAKLCILSSLMGAVVLLASDIVARVVIAPQELPLGVLTALGGGIYLLVLMHRRGFLSLERA